MKSIEEIIKDNLSLISSMVEGNKTDKEIAEKIGIGYSTYKRYKASDSELKEVIAEGKDKKNQAVEQALYNNCVGYTYTEEVAVKVKEEVLAEDGKTKLAKESVVVSTVERFQGPDLAAQKYWLNNKEKAKWKEDPHRVDNDKKLTKLKEKEVNSKVFEL